MERGGRTDSLLVADAGGPRRDACRGVSCGKDDAKRSRCRRQPRETWVQVYVIRGRTNAQRTEMKLRVGQRHLAQGGKGGEFSVPRKRKAFGEKCSECACRILREFTGAEVDPGHVKLAWVGADPRGRALRDFVVLEDDLGSRDETRATWKQNFRNLEWWSEAMPRALVRCWTGSGLLTK